MDFEQKSSQEKKNKDKRSYEQRLYTFASEVTFSISVPEVSISSDISEGLSILALLSRAV